MHIFHNDAKTFIKTKNKGKIYLDDSYYELNKKINSNKKFIEVHKSTITGSNTINIKSDDIIEYGKVN